MPDAVESTVLSFANLALYSSDVARIFPRYPILLTAPPFPFWTYYTSAILLHLATPSTLALRSPTTQSFLLHLSAMPFLPRCALFVPHCLFLFCFLIPGSLFLCLGVSDRAYYPVDSLFWVLA